MDYPQTFEPENKIPPRRCQVHDQELEWIEDGGRQVMRCRKCWEGERASILASRRDMPLIKFGQNFFRSRPFTAKEKQHPPRRPT